MGIAFPITRLCVGVLLLAEVWLLPLSSFAQETVHDHTADPISQAREMAETGEYDLALDLLDSQHTDLAQSYEARLLRGRIHSWNGEYAMAERELDSLLNDYPDNPDVQLALGYLYYYRGENRTSEQTFEKILIDHPDYKDASDGLDIVRRALQETKRYVVQAGIEYSSFSRSANEDWRQYSVLASRRASDRTLQVGFDHFERFSLNDDQFTAAYIQKFDSNWDIEAGALVVPDADFRPDWGTHIGLGRTISLGLERQTNLRLSGSMFLDNYEDRQIWSIRPSAEVYFGNGSTLSGRVIATKSKNEAWQYGGLVQGSIPITRRLSITVGAANAPEAVNSVVTETQSVFGYVSYDLSDSITLTISSAREDRSGSFIRETLGVSLSHLF